MAKSTTVNVKVNLESGFILELLCKALEFYGNEASYKKSVRDGTFISSVEEDKGERARITLQNIKDLMKVKNE